MHRDKFPETVPFRLTRMLVNAMEVSGIEGNYRTTCEHVMSVLRDSRDSLLAMLQVTHQKRYQRQKLHRRQRQRASN